ncbi:ABC transporter substrate-binding protein [Devosia faecipullorum]|uniref:ABC transporter substrate-binding protein n=1 Tax=Devosia faecipullorum TaxID=2755039 RepID=UPI00187BAEE2|nr:ABC transporter substrate-binding protein [Devosia faecipullorum]MBE7732587.1 ABC transporter substrate-binding protein [Devosia faecipullorum]
MSLKKTALVLLASASTLSGVVAQDQEAVLTAVPQQLTAWVENYNPMNATTVLPTVQDFLYEPLVIFNALKGGEASYRLASEYSYSDDQLELTFVMRPGVTWSDGTPLTAQDVAFTFNMVKEHPALDLRAVWPGLESVEAIDDSQVRFKYKEVNAGLIYQIVQTYVVPKHVWEGVEDPVTFTNPNPVGSGPLTEIRRFTPQEYIQCRNPKYWDAAELEVDCMRMPQVSNNDQVLTMASNGELDWFGSFIPDIERTYLAGDPDHRGYWFPAGSPVYFSLNMASEDPGLNEAFNDVDFRRAFSMAMDRQAMVDIAGYGYPTANEYASGLGQAYDVWNNAEAEAEFGQFAQFDIDAAKALLAEAGYADTDGDGFVESPSGAAIAFDIIVPNGWTDWVNTVQLAVEGLSEIGINASMATPESPAWTDALMSGNYKAAINSVTTGVSPHFFLDLSLHSRHIGQNRFASARYENAALDAALDNFNATTDEAAQRAAMSEILALIAADMPLINVFNNPLWYEYNTSRFTGFFNADNPEARPVVYAGVPERLLHLLALSPVE